MAVFSIVAYNKQELKSKAFSLKKILGINALKKMRREFTEERRTKRIAAAEKNRAQKLADATKDITTPQKAMLAVRNVDTRFVNGKLVYNHFWTLDRDIQHAVLDKLDSEYAGTLLHSMIFLRPHLDPWHACHFKGTPSFMESVVILTNKMSTEKKAWLMFEIAAHHLGGVYNLPSGIMDDMLKYGDRLGDEIRSLAADFPVYAAYGSVVEKVRNIVDRIRAGKPADVA